MINNILNTDSYLVTVFGSPYLKLLLVLVSYFITLVGYTTYQRYDIIGPGALEPKILLDTLYDLWFSYSMSFGLLLFFAPIGFYFISKDNKNVSLFVYIIVLTSSLVWFDTIYAILLMMPILSILVIIGLKNIFESVNLKIKNINISPILVAVLVIFFTIVPEFVVVNVTSEAVASESDAGSGLPVYGKDLEKISARNLGMYIKKECPYPMVHSIVAAGYITAFAEVQSSQSEMYIPVYSYDFTWGLNNLSRVLTGESDQVLTDTGPAGFNPRYKVLLSGYDKDKKSVEIEIKKISHYNAISFLVITSAPSPTLVRDDYDQVVESVFLKSVNEGTYTIYLGEHHKVNYLGYPN